MTTANIINYTLTRIKDNGLDLLKTTALAVGIFVAFLIVIRIAVRKVKERIQANSLQEDVYSQKVGNLA